MEILGPLIVFLFVAAIVIWLVVRGLMALWSAVFPRVRQPGGEGAPDVLPESLRALQISRREIARLYQAGLIDPATHEKVLAALDAEQRRRTLGHLAGVASPVAETPPAEVAATPDAEAVPPASVPMPAPSPPAVVSSPAPAVAVPPAAPVAPPKPRRSFAEMFSAFMEEKNIRWGELVGGMLIVLCSTALVVSLWSQIAAVPTVKFFVFTAVTAALFGAGLYTEHRWRLPTTSRGVLITATMLVPLTMLAIAAFSESPGTRQVLAVVAELVALSVFGVLLFWATRVIAPHSPFLLLVGVLGTSACQLLVRRLAGADTPTGTLLLLGGAPLVVYAGVVGALLWRALRWPTIDRPRANAIFLLLGVVAFAAVIPLGLLVFKTGNVVGTLRTLALLVTLFGVPPLACGLLFWRKLESAETALIRTAGTAIGVAGALLLALGLGLAWPEPARLLPVAALDFVLLAALALWFEIPGAHLPAGLCLMLAYLLAVHLWRHALAWHAADAPAVAEVLLSGVSGAILAPLVGALVVAGSILAWLRRPQHGGPVAAVGGIVAAVSIALLGWHGLGHVEDYGASWLFALYALGAVCAAGLVRRSVLAWLGAALLLLACVQGIVFRYGPAWGIADVAQAWQMALLTHASVAVLVTLLARWIASRGGAGINALISVPFRWAALLTSVAATMLLLRDVTVANSGTSAWHVCWLAGLWLILAWEARWPALFSGFQAATAFAAALAIVARLSHEAWFTSSATPLLDPRSIQGIAIGLTVLSLVWTLVRIGCARFADASSTAQPAWRTRAAGLLNPPWPSVDRTLAYAALLGLVALALYGVRVGVVSEYAAWHADVTRAQQGMWALAPFALGGGSWLLLAALLVTFTARLWLRFDRGVVVGLIGVGGVACVLAAGQHNAQHTTASALRFYLAVFWIIGSLAVWTRSSLARVVLPLGRIRDVAPQRDLERFGRVLLIATTVVPVVGLSVMAVVRAASGTPALGPVADSVFARLGSLPSLGVPLALVGVGLIGHALRDQRPGYAFAAGLSANLTATLVWLLAASLANRTWGSTALIALVQLNVLVAAAGALVWLAEQTWLRRIAGRTPELARTLLGTLVGLGVGTYALLLVPMLALLISQPPRLPPELAEVGSLLGWAALLVTCAAGIWLVVAGRKPWRLETLCSAALAAGVTAACSACRYDDGNWQGFHTLLIACAAIAWLPVLFLHSRGASWLRGTYAALTAEAADAQIVRSVRRNIDLIGILTLVLALRGAWMDPGRPWWSVGALVALGVLAALLARLLPIEAYLYRAAVLFNLAATAWWTTEHWHPAPARWLTRVIELVDMNVVALLITGLYSLALTRWGPRRVRDATRTPVFHYLAATAATVALATVVALGLVADAQGETLEPRVWVGWLGLAAAIVMTLACLWDRTAPALASLVCLLGLTTIGMGLDNANLSPHWLRWAGPVALAPYSLLLSLLWLGGARWQRWAARLRLPERSGAHPAPVTWLPPAHALATGAVILLSFWVLLSFSPAALTWSASAVLGLRLGVAAAVVVQALALGCVAHGLRRPAWQMATLAVGVVAVVAFGWAWIEPRSAVDNVLNRAVVVLVALAATATAYAFVLTKLRRRENSWTLAGYRVLPGLLNAGVGVLAFILGAEVFAQVTQHQVPMAYPAILAVLLTLAGLVPASLTFALVPGRDPFKLPDAKRTLYVYAAEALLALLFMHIRLTLPWLFAGFFERYWPLLVMLIAFVGVGLSELFRRQQRLVLAQPLERTGALLPMLPVLGFWALGGPVAVHYSIQLVLVGTLYAVLSIRRRSFGYGALAALAGNGGLWYLLHHVEGYGLLQHPQLWLIPAAASLLVAAHLNRDRLTAAQMTTIRYIGMLLICLSSTIEIFLVGVRAAPWLPLVLAGLSVLGVLAGIWLRVRSFLALGSSFLLISLLTMIWHASANLGWTWLWYVAGIALGLVIIIVFALFENRRAQITQLVERLKTWQA